MVLVGVSCGAPQEVARPEPTSEPTDGWADVVVEGGLGRALQPVLASHDATHTEPESATPRSPGAIDVLIGRAGDGRELSEEARALPVVRGWGEDEYEYEEEERAAGSSTRRTPRGLHVVLDVPYESWSGDGTFVHLTAFSPTMQPASGAEVYLDGRLVGFTEEHGTLAFRRQPRHSNESAEGTLRIRWRGHEREVSYEANARTPSFEQRTVYAYTDRGVYEPGQAVEVRAIAWQLRGEYRPVRDATLTLELLDPGGRVVGGGPLSTDRFGVGSSTLPLPTHAEEGPYTLVASIGEERAESRLIVQRFVAPAIEIRHDLPRFLTPHVAALRPSIQLGYFDGGTFERGTLRGVVKLRDRELARVEQDVVGAGPHVLAIDEARMRLVHAVAREGDLVEVALTVTDASGRSDTVRRFMQYTRNPYVAVLELDRTRYAPGEPVNVMLRLVDLDGVPVRDREVELTLPHGRPAGWRGTDREVEAAMERGDDRPPRTLTARTDDGGVARFRFAMPRLHEDLDDPSLEARIDDVADAIASGALPMSEPLPMRSAVDDTVVRAGSDVEVEVLFPRDARPLERVVHADVVDSSGAIIHAALVPIVNGRAVGRIRAPSWGSMLLTLYCVGRRGSEIGLMSNGQNLVVHPGERIRVRLSGLPEQARPGEHVRGSVRVEGLDGSPRDASVGLAVVDSAVISLLDPLERAPFDRFYNPERKVLATTGAQTLTWPMVNRTFGDARIDIAWPETFGWHGGPLVRPRPPRRARSSPSMAAESLDGLGSGSGYGSGYGMGGGGTGEGTIGLGNLGTIGHGAGRRSGRGAPAEGESEAPPPTTLVLRTRFDETALWAPARLTRDGQVDFELDLPDAITSQRFTVVASDTEGGIATSHVDLPVRQSMYVRSDLPAVLVEGDRVRVGVAVRNLEDASTSARVTLRSPDLEVEGGEATVEVPAQGTAVAWMHVRARRPGTARFELAAEARGLRDVEQRTLWVAPSGEPVAEESTGVVEGRWSSRFTLDARDRHHAVTLALTMPSAAVALDDVERLLADGYFGPDPAASRALAATAAYAYLERAGGLDDERRRRHRARLAELTSAILLGQRADGGWGWYWSGGDSVSYITVHAMHALIELRSLGFPVPDAALIAGRTYLLRSTDTSSRLDAAALAPWEAGGARARTQITAEMAHVLARLPAALRDGDPQLVHVTTSLLDELERADVDPLTLAHVVGAVHHLGLANGVDGLPERLRGAVQRLARIRDTVHWEPGWFDAWGGTVEAAAVTLEVLAAIDEPAYESARQDAVRFLLSTRGSFGRWHNARGTAWAIRALTLVDPGVRDDGGTLQVLVDGREVRSARIDARDPYTTSLALRRIELDALAPGEHEVEVRYDGRMRPRVALRVERWTDAAPGAPSPLTIERSLPSELRRGAPTPITLRIASESDAGPLVIELPLAPGLVLDEASVEPLRAAGTLLDARREGSGWVLGLPAGARHELALRVIGERTGELTWPAARVRSALGDEALGRSNQARLTVR
jgi:hypothetical protein